MTRLKQTTRAMNPAEDPLILGIDLGLTGRGDMLKVGRLVGEERIAALSLAVMKLRSYDDQGDEDWKRTGSRVGI